MNQLATSEPQMQSVLQVVEGKMKEREGGKDIGDMGGVTPPRLIVLISIYQLASK